ncbi:unnamed protein product [Fasciola hepatica]|uniref:60S ribosomal export protein NMD3 n=2 Tax=Fasciola hepatica TaxID=6192 RepID=A0ABC9HI65_FASHE
MCIKRIKGLNKGVSVKSAKFIWTEPHSRRLNVEITVHGELPTGDMVAQEILIEFVVHSQQCSDCTRTAAKDYWNACVQVRQRVDHKKTLINLEQTILRAGAHRECSNVKQIADGVDFYFGTRSQAVSFVNFLCKHAPCRYQTSQHLKSHDVHNNTYNYKFTFSVEIAGICKNDIVCLSKAQSQRLGGIGPLCVVTKVAEAIHLIDPVTCQICWVDGSSYFANPFTAIASQKQFSPFVIVEIEEDDDRTEKSSTGTAPVGARISQRHRSASVWLMRLNQKLDEDDPQGGLVHTRTHLGHIIHVGDTVRGLDFRNCNINHQEFEKLNESHIPDVILVLRATQSTDGDDLTETHSSRSVPISAKRRRQVSVAESSTTMGTTNDVRTLEPTPLDSGMELSEESDDNNGEHWFDVAE